MNEKYSGIDISYWQGANVDFHALQRANVDFVIARAGYGERIEMYWETNYKKAKATGMPIGAYWYSYATNVAEIMEEAKTFLAALSGKKLEYPVYLDFEDPTQTEISKELKTQMVETFCGILEDAGYYVGMYSFKNWLEKHFVYERIKRYTLWLAHWSDKTNYAKAHDVWQYTSNGSIAGVAGRVDKNISYKNFPEIIKAKGCNGFEKQQLETPKPKESNAIKVGDMVYIKQEATSYENKAIANWVYGTSHKVSQISGERVVLGLDGGIATAFYMNDLSKNAKNAPRRSVQVGDTVRVKSGSKDWNGKTVANFVFERTYKVSAITQNEKRAYIGAYSIKTAFHVDDLVRQ